MTKVQKEILKYLKEVGGSAEKYKMFRYFLPKYAESSQGREFFVYADDVRNLEKQGLIEIDNSSDIIKLSNKTPFERNVINYLKCMLGPPEEKKIMRSVGYKNKKLFKRKMQALQEKGIVEISTDNDKTYYYLKDQTQD